MSKEPQDPHEASATKPDAPTPAPEAPREAPPFKPDQELITYIERSQKPGRTKSTR